jgi:hypothetical protein
MKNIFHKKRSSEPVSTGKNDALSHNARWLCIGLILLFIIVVRIRLVDVPLERDEGEYAYMGQLLLQGVPPYSIAYNMKFPGTYLMYALMMSLFGQTTQGIHLGFMVLNCITIIIIYLLSKRLINDVAAVAAAGAYGILSLGPSVLGFAAHATHFVVLPAVGGALLLHDALEKNKPSWYFFSGAAFGLAFIMKQPGIFFILFGVSYILFHYLTMGPEDFSRRHILSLAFFLFAAILPLMVSMMWLYAVGVFHAFWFWTVQYAAKYGSQVPLSEAFSIFRSNAIDVIDGFYLLWIMSGLGFLVMMFHRDLKGNRMFIILFSIFSFLSICPGFYFREHYFITLLPAVSLCVGIFINALHTEIIARYKASWLRFAGLGIFIVIIAAGVVSQKEYFMTDDPVKISRKIYGDNPFPETVEIARFIQAESSPADKVAVFGSEPQIFFYAKRISATGYIYTYSLMESHDYTLSMQKEMVKEVQSSNPKFIIEVNVYTSWLVQPGSEQYIFGWLDDYVRNGYALVGVVDMISPNMTVYKWYDAADHYTVRSPSYVRIFKRVSNRPN